MKAPPTLSSLFPQLLKDRFAAAPRLHRWELSFVHALRLCVTVLLLPALPLTSPRSYAQETQPSEYQVKAAYLFNFAKFVEWPSAAFPDEKAPLFIGVFGDNPFGADLERFVRDKTVISHPVKMRECRTLEEAKKCHILFISASEKNRMPEILKALEGANVLTISETDGFTETGGMVNFVFEANKIRFQINDSSAKSAGLKISSKLLSLASSRRTNAGAPGNNSSGS